MATTWNDMLSAVLAAIRNGGVLSPAADWEAYEALSDPHALDLRDTVCETLGVEIRKPQFDESYFVFPSSQSSMFALSKQEMAEQLGAIVSKSDKDERGTTQAQAMWAVLYVLFVDYAFERSVQPECRALERPPISDFVQNCREKLKRGYDAYSSDDASSAFGEVCAALYDRPDTQNQNTVEREKAATRTLAGAINKMLGFLGKQGILDSKELNNGYIVPTTRGCVAYQFGIASRDGALPRLVKAMNGDFEDEAKTAQEETEEANA